jgi:hypothetical protein
MLFADFLGSVVLPAFVGTGSAWLLLQLLGGKIIEHRLSKDLERFKIELGERTDVLKTQLSIFAHEQNVATSRVDTQRADAIHRVYTSMRDVINPVSQLVAGTPIVNGTVKQSVDFYFENAEQAHEACGALVNTLSDLAIYFDNDTYSKVMQFVEAAMDAIARYLHDLRRLAAEGATLQDLLEVAETNRPALSQAQVQLIHPKATDLTVIFRSQLGIERPAREGAAR